MLRRVLPAAVLFAALAACSNACSNTASAPSAPQQPPAPAGAAKGRVVQEHFASQALGVDKDVVVYLPGGYDAAPDRHWPVFYYLHGLGGNEMNWVKVAKLDAAADELGLQAIVVMPDGDDSFYTDAAAPADYDACMKDGTGLLDPSKAKPKQCVRSRHYEEYITKDLVGWTDKTHRTIANRSGRAIAGLSMGGFGALELAFRHPDLFAAAASHSGVDALLYQGPHPYEKGKVSLLEDVAQWGRAVGPIGDWVRGIFGGDLASWQAHDPAFLASKLDPKTAPALYLDCGTEDGFLLNDGAAYLHDILLARGVQHEYFTGPGGHDFAFWIPRLPKSLAFLAAHTTPATR